MLRRPRSLVEWAGPAGVGALVVAARWDQLTAALDWQPACVVRSRLGVPCPFCGGTTAAVHLADGRVVDALQASPLAVLLGMVAVVGLVLYLGRALGWASEPQAWSLRTQRWAALGMAAVLAGSWLYQLDRLGLS